MLISLLFFQSFLACQQAQEKAFPLADSIQSIITDKSVAEKAPFAETNIVLKSYDNGQSWQDISTGLNDEKATDFFLFQKNEIVTGNNNELFHSPITAKTPFWEKELLLDNQIYGIYAGQNGLYSLNSARNKFSQNISKGLWTPAFPTLKVENIRTIFECQDGTILVGCDNGIFKSIDKGKSWKQVYEIGWMISVKESNGVLICTNEKGILRSEDGGEHWNLVISEGGVGIYVEAIEGSFAAITYNTESKTRRIRISTDSGKTWQPIDAGLPPSANISSIKKVGNHFFCGHPDGIFRSTDQGKTWELILPSIGKKVFNLFVSDKVIYAIPRDGGC
jgi:BNR/Asp-box repeat